MGTRLFSVGRLSLHGRTSDGVWPSPFSRLPNRIIPKEARRKRKRNPPFMPC